MEPYNSLKDPHLSNYFSNEFRKRQMIKSGLVNNNGELISESTYKLNAIRREKSEMRIQLDEKVEKNRKYKILPRVNIPSEDFNINNNNNNSHQQKFMSAGNQRSMNRGNNNLGRVRSAPDQFYANFQPFSNWYQNKNRSILWLEQKKQKYKNKNNNFKNNPNNHIFNDIIKVHVSADNNNYEGFVTCSALPTFKKQGVKELKLKGTLQLSSKSNHQDNCNLDNNNINKNCIFIMRYHRNKNITTASEDSLGCKSAHIMVQQESHFKKKNFNNNNNKSIINNNNFNNGSLVVFDETVDPGSNFSFESRCLGNKEFSLTIWLNDEKKIKIILCCEGRYKNGGKIITRDVRLTILKIKNAKFCKKCLEKIKLKANRKNSKENNEKQNKNEETEKESDFEKKEEEEKEEKEKGEEEEEGEKKYYHDNDYSDDYEIDEDKDEKNFIKKKLISRYNRKKNTISDNNYYNNINEKEKTNSQNFERLKSSRKKNRNLREVTRKTSSLASSSIPHPSSSSSSSLSSHPPPSLSPSSKPQRLPPLEKEIKVEKKIKIKKKQKTKKKNDENYNEKEKELYLDKIIQEESEILIKKVFEDIENEVIEDKLESYWFNN